MIFMHKRNVSTSQERKEPLGTAFSLAARVYVSSGALCNCDKLLRKFLADKNAEVDISYRIVLWLYIYKKNFKLMNP